MITAFTDDSRQATPTRAGMGPLVAAGAVFVKDGALGELERAIHACCVRTGFPAGEAGEFKWSPGRELWMHANLTGGARHDFFVQVLQLVRASGAAVIVVVEDTGYRTANATLAHEFDAVVLLIERINNQFTRMGADGIVIADRPPGGRAEETKFLQRCLETLQAGTVYVTPDRIAVNVVSAPSKLIRLLQVADLITSCTLSFVSGEDEFSPPIFDIIREMLPVDYSRRGGIGVKIHPDMRYANLYHWLLHDADFVRYQTGTPMPISTLPYASSPLIP